MEPLVGLGLLKAVADAAKSVGEIMKGVKDHEIKGKLNAVYDTLISLKQESGSA